MELEAPDIETQDPPQTGDPVLLPEHKKKLDNIVLQLHNKGASKEDTVAVVNDFKTKYAQKSTPAPSQPAVKDFSGIPPEFSGNDTKTSYPSFLNNEVEKHQVEVGNAHDRIQMELDNLNPAIKSIISDTKHQKAAADIQQSIQQKGTDATANTQLNQRVQRLLPKAAIDVSPEEIDDFREQMYKDPAMQRDALNRTAKLHPLRAHQIQADIYLADADNRNANPSKALHNFEQIRSGNLNYDLKKGLLTKEEGFIGSLSNSYDQRKKQLSDYKFFEKASDPEIIDKLEKEQNEFDLDKPQRTASGVGGHLGEIAGGQPPSALIAGWAIGSIPGAEEMAPWAAALASSPEVAMRGYAGALSQHYYEERQKGASPEHALAIAKNLASFDAKSDVAQNVLATAAGVRTGLKPLTTNFSEGFIKAVSKGAKNLLKQTASEALPQGAIAGGLQALKNWHSGKSLGKDVDVAAAQNAAAVAAIGLILKPTSFLKKGGSLEQIQSGLKANPELTNKNLGEMVQSGDITPEQANQVTEQLKLHEPEQSNIPADVTDEGTRKKLQTKFNQYDELKAKLETQHESTHPAIKEKMKGLEEEIGVLSKPTPKAEQTEQPVDKLQQAKDIVAEKVNDGDLSEVYGHMMEQQPEKFLNFIADQAIGRTEDGKVDAKGGNEESMRKEFGDEIVDLAKEMFPTKESKISVIQPGELKHPETITIKPQEHAPTIESGGKVDVGEPPINGETVGEGNPKQEKPAGTQAEVKNPGEGKIEEPPTPPESDLPFHDEPGDNTITSIKNKVTSEKIKEAGLEPALEEGKRSHQQVWDEAVKKVNKGYDPQSLVDALKKKPRAVTDSEDALLLIHQVSKEAELDSINKEINEAGKNGDEGALAEAQTRKAKIKDDLQDIYDVDKSVGRETARGLSARQMVADRKYSLVNMENELRASNNGEPLSEEQSKDIEKRYNDIKAAKEALEAKVKELEERATKTRAGTGKSVKEKGKVLADKIRGLKINKGNTAQANILGIPTAIYDSAITIIADAVQQGASLVDAIQQGIQHLKTQGYIKDTKEEEDFTNHIHVSTGNEREFLNILDPDVIKLRAGYERAKANFDANVHKAKLKKQSTVSKVADGFVKWERAGKLSWPSTIAKLASAGLTRLVQTPVEDIVGSGIGTILPKEVTSKATGEAGFNVKAQAKALTAAFTKGMTDAADIMGKGKLGKSDIDFAFGDRKLTLPPEAAEFFGRLHSATKAPVKRAAFERSLEKRIAANIKNGVDVTDPMVQTKIGVESYKDANRAIFMQDNFVSDAYRNFVNGLENNTNYPNAGKLTASALNWLIPFVKVPTNIVGESVTHIVGVPYGAGKIVHTMFTKGLKNLTTEEADMVMRNLKKGSLGAGALLLGYFNPTKFGGFYQDKEKRKEGDIKALQAKIGDTTIPSWLLHSPLFQVMQLGATVRRVKDTYMEKGKDNPAVNGVMAGALGLIKELPLTEQPMEVAKLFDPKERDYYLGELAKNTADPGLLQYIAKLEQGYNPLTEQTAHKPAPKTILEHVETGLPGLTENVGEKQQSGGGKNKNKKQNKKRTD